MYVPFLSLSLSLPSCRVLPVSRACVDLYRGSGNVVREGIDLNVVLRWGGKTQLLCLGCRVRVEQKSSRMMGWRFLGDGDMHRRWMISFRVQFNYPDERQ